MSRAVLNIPQTAPKDIRQFYDRYAGMLLGFIRGTIQDQKRSEEYLVKIITSFVSEGQPNNNGLSTWLQLRQYAQRKLAQHASNNGQLVTACVSRDSKHAVENLDVLSARERSIFQAVYYQGKSITNLAETLGEQENAIRIQLKSSIDKMRRARGN